MALEEVLMELQAEQAYFEQIRSRLLAEHEGKFALIKGSELVGTYDTAENAYVAGVGKFGNVPFLVKQIDREDKPVHLPAMTLGLLGAV